METVWLITCQSRSCGISATLAAASVWEGGGDKSNDAVRWERSPMSMSLLQIPHHAQERGSKAVPRELLVVKYILPTLGFRQHKHLFFKTTLEWVISPGWVSMLAGFK